MRFPGSERNKSRIDGSVGASGFKEYIWAAPTKDNTDEKHLFIPYGAGNDPYDFTGATGLQFLSEIDVQASILLDTPDGCGFAGILQYSIPEAPFDGYCQWYLQQHFEIPIITCNADHGYVSLVSTGRACPLWEDFPAPGDFVEAFSLSQLSNTIWAEGESFSIGPFNATDMFQSSFQITKGQKSCIYMGFSIYIMACDGYISLGDPNMAYHVWTEPGINYSGGLGYTFFQI
jgi:hypothetical protein